MSDKLWIDAADAFDHWLQGRINICITGLMDRLNQAERQVAELAHRFEQAERQNAELVERLDRYAGPVDGEAIAAAVREALCDPEVLTGLLDDLKGHDDWNDAVLDALQDSALQDAVEDCLNDSSKLAKSIVHALRTEVCVQVDFS